MTGELRTLIRMEHKPRRVQSDERERYFAAVRRRPPFYRLRQETPASRRRQAVAEEAFSNVDFPETMPVIHDFRAATDGTLWIREYVSDLGRPDWTVFSPEGTVVARAMMPLALTAEFTDEPRLQEIGSDYVLGIVGDEQGVVRIHVYPIERDRDADHR